VVVACVGIMRSSGAESPSTKPTASERDHAIIIRFLEERVGRDPDDITAENRLAGQYLWQFRQTGDDRYIGLSAAAAARSLKSVPAEQNSAALGAKARAEFTLHHFAEARDDGLQLVNQEPDKVNSFAILGDALLELGDYDKAAEAYSKLHDLDDADPASVARMARLVLIRGDNETARGYYAAAITLAKSISPPQPDLLAWCLVQAGQLDFITGRWDAAEEKYQAALQAHPGDWSAVDHLAELRAGQRRFDEAISTYVALVARVPRPELFQALGDVCTVAAKKDDAARWHRQALDRYLLAAAESPQYDHHLAGFYCDSEPNPPEALQWARKDMANRHSVYAYDSLAWALYQNGQFPPAAQAMDKALALGTKDSHLLYHASLIYYGAGDLKRGKDCLRAAAQVNPKFMEFHEHR